METNLDDCPGQLVARAIEAALAAGAKDAWAAPLTMKKGRPGILLGALVAGDRRDAVARVLLDETTTLGVRLHPVERIELERELVTVDDALRRGAGEGGPRGAASRWGRTRSTRTAWPAPREHGVPVREVMAAALTAFRTAG